MTDFQAHTTWIFDIMTDSKTKEQEHFMHSAFFCQIKINIDSYALAFALAESLCEEIHKIHYSKEEHYDYKVYPVASKFWNMRVRE